MTRCFVVGNGKSLNKHDLNLLVNEITYGVNRIHLIYPKTKWRPTHWVLMDRSKWTESNQDILFHLKRGYLCYVREDIIRQDFSGYENYIPIKECDHIDIERNPATAWHEGICKFGGSVPSAIQLAARRGYNPIYLIGLDHKLEPNSHNHFDPGYVSVNAHKDFRSIDLTIGTWEAAYKIARRECEARGIEIYNATTGGYCEVFKRVDYEVLF